MGVNTVVPAHISGPGDRRASPSGIGIANFAWPHGLGPAAVVTHDRRRLRAEGLQALDAPLATAARAALPADAPPGWPTGQPVATTRPTAATVPTTSCPGTSG